MLSGKRIIVVMPPYHAGRTLEATWRDQALARGADIVVMVHPDCQYEPRLVTAMPE